MKKFSAILATIVMMVSAFLVASGPSVAAAAPYPGSVKTKTYAAGVGCSNVAKVFVKVTSFGNGKPTGRILFTFVGRRGKVHEFDRRYDGKQIYNFYNLKRGPYDVLASYNPPEGSVYRGSAGSTHVRVTRHHRNRHC